MTGGSHIRAVGPGSESRDGAEMPLETTDEALVLEEDWEESFEEEPAARTRGGWIYPALAILAVLGWTGFFAWANRAAFGTAATPDQWIDWIVAWSVPVLLVVALWLLAMRNSRREAGRFADAASALSNESARLEHRLSVVNRELSLAREFLAAQSRGLESLGRVASERISEHADRLQGMIVDNGQQVHAIAAASHSAMENMERLRGDLPVISNSARDVSNQIGNAGIIASERLEELIGGFHRLNEFGEASERQVHALSDVVERTLDEFDTRTRQLGEIVDTRFGTLREKSEDYRVELDGREVEALAAMRNRADRLRDEIGVAREALDEHETESLRSLQARITAIRDGAGTIARALADGEKTATDAWRRQIDLLKGDLSEAIQDISRLDEAALASARERLQSLKVEGEAIDANTAERNRAFDDEMEKRRELLALHESEHAEALVARLAHIDAEIAGRRAEHEAQTQRLAEHSEAVAARLGELRDDMHLIAAQGSETEQGLAAGIEALTTKLAASRAALDGTDTAVAELTEASVRLLELIQASAQHSREALPAAMADADARLTGMHERVEALRLLLAEAGERSADISNHVQATSAAGREALDRIEQTHGRFEDVQSLHAERIEDLRGSLAALSDESAALSQSTQSSLREAIDQLRQAARDAVASIESESGSAIRSVAERIGDETAEAVDAAVRERVIAAIRELDQAAANATATGREAAMQLRDQLAKVNELAGNLENRVARARHRAEEQVDNDFSRRVALITEALNSNAIDISKALSSEVSDTAWASYLRGDRGIFTRRAVHLLSNSEARDIAEAYSSDADFREHVSRYIHDFEAMLRTMLSTRDGHAIGVTLLSSDMGKLYVALAQAIERLRD